jgi:hypothetical protein
MRAAYIAEDCRERNLREGEARLPIEEQLSFKLRRFIEANIPELTVDVRVEKRR